MAPLPESLIPTVTRVYAALAAGDEPTLMSILAPEFHASFAPGMPNGLGGVRQSAAAAVTDGWWAIGRAFRVRAVPDEWVECVDGRLLVLGAYRGTARLSGGAVRASFAHLWSGVPGTLQGLVQTTDTALWAAALAAP
jgi:ketosteroid isomerase-like protein